MDPARACSYVDAVRIELGLPRVDIGLGDFAVQVAVLDEHLALRVVCEWESRATHMHPARAALDLALPFACFVFFCLVSLLSPLHLVRGPGSKRGPHKPTHVIKKQTAGKRGEQTHPQHPYVST